MAICQLYGQNAANEHEHYHAGEVK